MSFLEKVKYVPLTLSPMCTHVPEIKCFSTLIRIAITKFAILRLGAYFPRALSNGRPAFLHKCKYVSNADPQCVWADEVAPFCMPGLEHLEVEYCDSKKSARIWHLFQSRNIPVLSALIWHAN